MAASKNFAINRKSFQTRPAGSGGPNLKIHTMMASVVTDEALLRKAPFNYLNSIQIFNHIKNLKKCISTQNTRSSARAHAQARTPARTHRRTRTNKNAQSRADQSTRKVRRPEGLLPWPKALSRSQSRPSRDSPWLKSRCTAKDSLFSALRRPSITRVLGLPRTAWVMLVACQFSVLAPLTHSRMSPSLTCRNRRMSD